MNCPLCQSPTESSFQAHAREYHFCKQCALVSVPPRFHLSPKDEQARYLEHENSLENEGYVDMFEKKLDLVQTHCPGINTVLDFGCGYEPVLKTLLERRGYQADIYDSHFFPEWEETKRFDLIISTETFEHLKHPGEEMDRLLSVLVPGGYLAVMTRFYPAPGANQVDATQFSDWYYARDPTHIVFFQARTFEWMARHWNLKGLYSNQKDFIVFQKNS